MDFLLNLATSPECAPELRAEIDARCLATGRWLVSEIRPEGTGRASWDGGSWDTAVCLRTLLRFCEYFAGDLGHDELRCIREQVQQIVNWLVAIGLEWERDVRYAAGPPDLGQVLTTLVMIAKSNPRSLKAAEKSAGLASGECVIDEIARLLVAMHETRAIPGAADGQVTRGVFWVDAFNTSEVIEALSVYVTHTGSAHRWGSQDHGRECKELLFGAIRFLELTQVDGMWGGVADTCGTLVGYLRVVGDLDEIDHVPHVVFKALRWMCEDDKALADGSFLHTSYITVFYASALWEAYSRWELATRPTTEVYDISLWVLASPVLHERSRRLELELKVADLSQSGERLGARLRSARGVIAGWAAGLIVVSGGLGLAVLAHVADWKTSVTVRDWSLMWGYLAVWVPVSGSLVGAAVSLAKRRAI